MPQNGLFLGHLGVSGGRHGGLFGPILTLFLTVFGPERGSRSAREPPLWSCKVNSDPLSPLTQPDPELDGLDRGFGGESVPNLGPQIALKGPGTTKIRPKTGSESVQFSIWLRHRTRRHRIDPDGLSNRLSSSLDPALGSDFASKWAVFGSSGGLGGSSRRSFWADFDRIFDRFWTKKAVQICSRAPTVAVQGQFGPAESAHATRSRIGRT